MLKALAIAEREIRASLVTPLAYVLTAAWMMIGGFFFFNLLQGFPIAVQRSTLVSESTPTLNDHVIVPFYETLGVVVIFLVPVLAMRALAEEKRSGTIELLMTSPVSSAEVTIGKFLGLAGVLAMPLAASLVYPLILIIFTDPEITPALIGFAGLSLFALAMLAVAFAISAAAGSQTIAGVAGVIVLLLFYLIDVPAGKFSGTPGEVLKYLAPSRHLGPLLKGVMTGSDLVFFCSVIFIGIFTAQRIIRGQRGR